MSFELLWKEYSTLPEVDAIALGGSRAGTVFDTASDYDLYVYCSSLPSEDVRKTILRKYCSYMEIGNCFWETEDDCTLNEGPDIDILYRNASDFANQLSSVVEDFTAYNGYTTCMWHNLLHSTLLYDRKGIFSEMVRRFSVPYPEKLRQNIIEKNLRLLHGSLPSYDLQISKALQRGDFVSVNHRVAAFLESYFDIIFAYNRLTHPGEKRMLSYALSNAQRLPENFENNVNTLLKDLFTLPESVSLDLQEIVKSLHSLVNF